VEAPELTFWEKLNGSVYSTSTSRSPRDLAQLLEHLRRGRCVVDDDHLDVLVLVWASAERTVSPP
jgi:hypothetical protein